MLLMSFPTMRSQGQSKPREPRMRDSCEACAKSKLKCSRDKPTCKRCQNRGLACLYCPSQRAGRTPSTSVGATSVAAPKRPRSPLTPVDAKSLSPQPHGVVPNKAPSSESSAYGPFDFFDGATFNEGNNADVMFLPPQEDMDLDTAMADPLNFQTSILEQFDLNYNFSDQNSAMQITRLKTSEDSTSLFNNYTTASFQIQSPPPTLPTLSREGTDHNRVLEGTIPELVRSHSCFSTATSILAVQCSSMTTACMQATSASQSSSLPTINSVIAQNRSTIESLNSMLTCPCALDRHLITIMFLIALKVVAWYAAVARSTSQASNYSAIEAANDGCSRKPSPERVLQAPTTVGRYHLDGDDSSRMRAQLVLSELHRVQRVVELMSKRLEVIRQQPDSTSSYHNTDACEENVSVSVFTQLEADVRRRLLAVSKDMMEILREG